MPTPDNGLGVREAVSRLIADLQLCTFFRRWAREKAQFRRHLLHTITQRDAV